MHGRGKSRPDSLVGNQREEFDQHMPNKFFGTNAGVKPSSYKQRSEHFTIEQNLLDMISAKMIRDSGQALHGFGDDQVRAFTDGY